MEGPERRNLEYPPERYSMKFELGINSVPVAEHGSRNPPPSLLFFFLFWVTPRFTNRKLTAWCFWEIRLGSSKSCVCPLAFIMSQRQTGRPSVGGSLISQDIWIFTKNAYQKKRLLSKHQQHGSLIEAPLKKEPQTWSVSLI